MPNSTLKSLNNSRTKLFGGVEQKLNFIITTTNAMLGEVSARPIKRSTPSLPCNMGSLLFWKCISYSNTGILVKCNGKITIVHYQILLTGGRFAFISLVSCTWGTLGFYSIAMN